MLSYMCPEKKTNWKWVQDSFGRFGGNKKVINIEILKKGTTKTMKLPRIPFSIQPIYD